MHARFGEWMPARKSGWMNKTTNRYKSHNWKRETRIKPKREWMVSWYEVETRIERRMEWMEEATPLGDNTKMSNRGRHYLSWTLKIRP